VYQYWFSPLFLRLFMWYTSTKFFSGSHSFTRQLNSSSPEKIWM
jgi:hypothetical protein